VFTLALGIKWQCDVNMQINSDFKETFSSGLRELKINWRAQNKLEDKPYYVPSAPIWGARVLINYSWKVVVNLFL
jgi:hypothetical protein